MRHIAVFLGICSFCFTLSAQQIGRKVISATGSSIDIGTINVSYTIGEVVVTTQGVDSLVITQGFQQPDAVCGAVETTISTQNTTQRCKDGFSQFITLENTGDNVIPGVNYTYVITSLDQTIVQAFSTNLIDLNILAANTYRIYGVMHETAYSPIPGEKIQESDPGSCRRVSNNFLPVVFSLPPPEAQIALPSTDTTLCGNPQISIRGIEPLNGSGFWRGSTGIQFVDPFSPTTLLTNLQPGPNTISWEVSTPGCPPKSSAVEIEYEPPADPAEIELSSVEVCSNEGHQISARPPLAGLSGVWSSKRTGVSLGPDLTLPNITVGNLPTDTTVLYWTVGEAPCQTVDSILVINNAVQTLPQITSPPNTGAVSIVCTNQINLNGQEPQEGEIARWNLLNGSGMEFSPNNESPNTILRNIPENQEISLVYEIVKEGCNSNLTDTLTLFNKGGVTAATIVQNDTTLCQGSGLQLSASVVAPDEVGFWTTNPPLQILPGEESPEIEIGELPIGETEFIWTIQAVDCPDNTASIMVNVPDPNADLFGEDTVGICQEDPIYLASPKTEGLGNIIEFLWSTGENTPSIDINPDIGDFTSVSVMVLNLSGCSFSDSLTLKRDSLEVGIEATAICNEDGLISPADLLAKGFGITSGLSFSWSNGARGEAIQVEEPGLYQVTATSENGCVANTAIEIEESAYIPTTSPGDTSIILGTRISLTANGGDSYVWSSEEQLSCTICQSPTSQPLESTDYTVSISTFEGCTSELSFRVNVVDPEAGCEALYIPNVLTPGDNGFNDRWELENLAEGSEIYIYDRWGGEVFSATPYTTPWDGRKRGGGGFVEEGTYLYVLKLKNEQVCRGSLTVIPD